MSIQGLLLMVVIFLITVAAMVYDPLNLNVDGLEGRTAWVALYGVLGFGLAAGVYLWERKKLGK